MKRVDDFRLMFGKKELVPIIVGGMGVDISTAELALEAARLGGIGHISDAMVNDVSDRRFDTSFVKDKTRLYKHNILNADKSGIKFDLDIFTVGQTKQDFSRAVKTPNRNIYDFVLPDSNAEVSRNELIQRYLVEPMPEITYHN